MFTAINDIVNNALSGVTSLTTGTTGTIITFFLGVTFLVLLIGGIYSIVHAVKRFGGKKR